MTINCLDLFGGYGGWSQAFVNRGHNVQRVELDVDKFHSVPFTTFEDVLTYRPREAFDVILASPPCQAFSLSSVRHHFTASASCVCGERIIRVSGERWSTCACEGRPTPGPMRFEPKSDFGALSLRLVDRTLELMKEIQPKFWWMENPRATMQHFIPSDIPKVTVWYCRYGDSSAKPTHLWGNWPDTWAPRPECHNGNPDHQEARRGAKTGTQGKKGAALRALVPYELSLEVCLAVEAAL